MLFVEQLNSLVTTPDRHNGSVSVWCFCVAKAVAS